jgi:DNA polymerase-3 subunit delta'
MAQALGAAPAVVSRPADRHEILMAQVREVIRELSFASRDPRAVIFDDAHRMSEEAMNACLKTLEEPPKRTVIILVTHVPDRLLPTIRSRCHTVLFAPLADEEVARYARERLGLPESDARLVSALADGSPGTASALAREIRETAASSRELQERVVRGELNPVVEALTRIRDTEQARRAARRALRLLAHGYREALMARSGGRPVVALPAFLERAATLDDEDLLARIETLLDHERAIELNANVGLAVEDALLRL